ncbi:hypothetical protein Mapa_003680 [Marchantia paleacea]|nr:hypothetical protein Mapa_003680 [Marchantia paleacea]
MHRVSAFSLEHWEVKCFLLPSSTLHGPAGCCLTKFMLLATRRVGLLMASLRASPSRICCQGSSLYRYMAAIKICRKVGVGDSVRSIREEWIWACSSGEVRKLWGSGEVKGEVLVGLTKVRHVGSRSHRLEFVESYRICAIELYRKFL